MSEKYNGKTQLQVGDNIYQLDDIECVALVFTTVSIKLTDGTVHVILQAETKAEAQSYHQGFMNVGFVLLDLHTELVNPHNANRALRPKPIFN